MIMRNNMIMRLVIYLMVVGMVTACGKEFLDIKRQANQVVPKYIRDYEALVNNYEIFNASSITELAFISSDEYTITDTRLNALSQPYQRNAYTWQEDVLEDGDSQDWNRGYQRVLYSNMALEVEKVTPTEEEKIQWNNVRGAALFLRSFAFFQLAQLFAPEYSLERAAAAEGIPLRLDYDMQVRVRSSKLTDVYETVIRDLNRAETLLPEKADSHFKVGRQAVYALLARVYLHMGNYWQADQFAAKALEIDDTLIDFKTLNTSLPQSFKVYGEEVPEVIFYQSTSVTIINASRLDMNKDLLQKYEYNDVRKDIYFLNQPDGRVVFKGSYSGGGGGYFCGLATDELYLIRAECLTRLENVEQGLYWLNLLLEHRYDDSFIPLTLSNKDILLKRVLEEREKELCMRSIRWNDMRRMNKESAFAKTYSRFANGMNYTLRPDSPAWTFSFPRNETNNNSF